MNSGEEVEKDGLGFAGGALEASAGALSALAKRVNEAGFRVNNLFQLDDGQWRANLTDGRRYWGFGTGTTGQEALEDAWQQTKLDPWPRAKAESADELGL
jgi:hypothetical protein